MTIVLIVLCTALVLFFGFAFWYIEVRPAARKRAEIRANEACLKDGVCPKCGGGRVAWELTGMRCADCRRGFEAPSILAQRIRDARAKKVDEFIREQARKGGAP